MVEYGTCTQISVVENLNKWVSKPCNETVICWVFFQSMPNGLYYNYTVYSSPIGAGTYSYFVCKFPRGLIYSRVNYYYTYSDV